MVFILRQGPGQSIVLYHYNIISILQNIDKAHPIASPWGQAMVCLLQVECMVCHAVPPSLQFCIQYHVYVFFIEEVDNSFQNELLVPKHQQAQSRLSQGSLEWVSARKT